MLLLTKSDVERAINMREAIDAVERTFSSFSAGQAAVPLRTQVEVAGKEAVSLYMPGFVPDLGARRCPGRGRGPDYPHKKGAFPAKRYLCRTGEISSGRKKGREDDIEVTLFKSVGLSVQDMAVAIHALKKAKELGLGREFTFTGQSDSAGCQLECLSVTALPGNL